jgi:hypothetical protein
MFHGYFTLNLIKISLDLHFSLADAMGFVPVEFNSAYPITSETDSSNSFALAPASFSKLLSQAVYFANAMRKGNRFDLSDFTYYFKVHVVRPFSR